MTTYSLNSSVNGTSFRKTQGYPNRLLKRSSSCLTLDKALSSSEFRTSMMRAALARRVALEPCSYSETAAVGIGEEDESIVGEVLMDTVAFESVNSTKDSLPVGHRNTRIVMLYSGRRYRRIECKENYIVDEQCQPAHNSTERSILTRNVMANPSHNIVRLILGTRCRTDRV